MVILRVMYYAAILSLLGPYSEPLLVLIIPLHLRQRVYKLIRHKC